MSVSTALAAFIEHEEREQLFERSALGVPYWHAIRHDVFQETLQALGLAERAHQRTFELPLRGWLPDQLRGAPRTLRRSIWRGLPRVPLLVANHPRHLVRQGEWICPYTQPLTETLPQPRVVIEGQYLGRYARPGPEQPTAYVDLPLVLAHLAFRAAELRGHGFGRAEQGELAAIREGLLQALGAAPPLAALVRRARTAVLATRGLTPRYERLLDRVQPRLILMVIGYRLVNQILTQVAHRRGLIVAELQHGTLGPAHPAYNFAPGRRPESFPDYLLLFGELWRSATPGLPLPAAHTPAIGYRWLEYERERHARTTPPAPRRVLFLSQRSIGRELVQVATRLRELAPPDAFHIAYRLHPSEVNGWRASYPALAHSAIEVQAAGSVALYAAQRDSDVQVGVYSTALVEGVALGLQTFIVELPGHEQLEFLVTAGHARRVGSAEPLLAALNEPVPAAAPDVSALWAPGAVARFSAFVEGILAS